jgi:radical SAM protein with 4Fe4S-binding SPASM domain
MIPSPANLERLVRQFWTRRREFGQPAFWAKTGRIGLRLAQTWAWPERLLRESIEVLEDRPWNLHIETTNACNADCVFCGYQYMERPKKVMTMEVYERALQQYLDLGGGDLLLEVVVGDPILDPTFLKKIQVARSHPEIARIETITNGIAVHKIGAEKLVESGISKMFISTSGFDRESYEQIYRSKDYDRMRGNVLDLLRANRRAGDPVEIIVGLRTNRPLEAVMADPDFQEIKALGPQIDFSFALDDWMGRIKFDELPKGFVKREAEAPRESCAWLYDGPIVFTNGDLGLCGCRDVEAKSELVVGNILDKPLGELWRSDEVKRLRARVGTDDKPDICRSCTMYRNLDALRTFKGRERTRLTRSRLRASRCSPPPNPRRDGGAETPPNPPGEGGQARARRRLPLTPR